MKKFKRIFLIVADSMGVGQLPDAQKYGDLNTNTLKHLSYSKDDFKIPTLQSLGIGNITEINNTKATSTPLASFGKMKEVSVGKDTLTGHWEIMGLNVKKAFPSFTDNGFPDELINMLIEKTGRGVLGNCAASGTEILKTLGEEHMRTGKLIVYTSADSVLQIAAHEEVVPLEELYKICEIARQITLKEEWKVGRIIARPFVGEVGNFTRTSNRHDYALNPASKTTLNYLCDAGLDVISIGKIADVFNNSGITESIKTKDNMDGIEKIKEAIKKDFKGLCFANLNDFDSKYGHRRDVEGYSNALKELDDNIPSILDNLRFDDLLIIASDHGNDPTYKGTDHTRETIPVLIYSKKFSENGYISELETFSDIGATISDNFNVEIPYGKSFLKNLK